MFNLLLQIKNYYLDLKKYYYSIVLIEKKNLYYYHQTINYLEQNIYGLMHNLVSSLWLLIFFAGLFKDIIYLYLAIFILFFGFILFLFLIYIPEFVPKKFLTGLLSLSYFYKVESDISNIIIYLLFLTLLFLNIFLNIKTYFFIRLLFFSKCFLTFIFIFYQSFPNLQINVLKYSLIKDEQLLDVLHPIEKVKLDDFLSLMFQNNEITLEENNKILNRYKKLKEVNIQEISVPYERKIINDKIIIYEYKNIANSLNKLLDKTEEAINTGIIKNSKN